MKATLIENLAGWRGDARLYRVDPPMTYDDDKKTNYVVVSAAVVIFSGPETYIFPATRLGEILDWLELPGSFRGGLDHARALEVAGYSLSTQ